MESGNNLERGGARFVSAPQKTLVVPLSANILLTNLPRPAILPVIEVDFYGADAPFV